MAAVETKVDMSPESALAERFAQTRAELPGGWLQSARSEAMARLQRDGLPHRRIEAWKYTDFRNKIDPTFGLPQPAGAEAESLFDDLKAHRLHIVSGKAVAAPAAEELPDGVELMNLAEALAMPSLWLRQWLQPTDDAIENLNLAFASDGALIRVGRGLQVTAPIVLRTSSHGGLAHTRNVIALEENAELILIEIDDGSPQSPSLTTTMTAISLEAGARLRHLRVTKNGAHSIVVRTDGVEIASGASYRGIVVSSGAALARQQATAKLVGEGAAYALACAYAAGEAEHTDFTINVVHEAPQTTSRLIAKGVAAGTGHGVVQGRVVVKPAAQKSDSHQLARGLLLSPQAEIDQKPELEIFADDVKCGHGAAIGALDANQLFYLRSRGIPEAEARGVLVGAFLREVTDRLPDPYREPVESWLTGRMAEIAVEP